jgi:hypothetical protein
MLAFPMVLTQKFLMRLEKTRQKLELLRRRQNRIKISLLRVQATCLRDGSATGEAVVSSSAEGRQAGRDDRPYVPCLRLSRYLSTR